MSKSSASKSVDRRQVAVIGCGPAGLTAASLLGQAGHNVIVRSEERRVGKEC